MRRRAEELSYHKYKVLKVPSQNGRRRPGMSPVMRTPCQCSLSELWPLVINPSEFPYRRTVRKNVLIDVPFKQKR